MKTLVLGGAVFIIALLGGATLAFQVQRIWEIPLPVIETKEFDFKEIHFLLNDTADRISQTASSAVQYLIQNRAEPGRDPP